MVSSKLTISTRSPQGRCLSPKYLTLYTHKCVFNTNDAVIIKYADNTTIVGLIKGGDETAYSETVDSILDYGEENHLILNVGKTRELIVDFHMKAPSPYPFTISRTEVEWMDSHKVLYLHISSDLSW